MVDTVDFTPTKKLFIDVLTRDISIRDCVLDLIDNSVDAYTRNKIEDTRNISLTIGENTFEIKDTCGGISKRDVTKEVFRLGATDSTAHGDTIGVYGIGLKRAVFKLGKMVQFETDDGVDYCRLIIDVDEWAKEDKQWGIELTETRASNLDGKKPYTNIRITSLKDETKDVFRMSSFRSSLLDTVSKYYSWFISEKKIAFAVDGESVSAFDIKIKVSDNYKPVKLEETYNEDVKIRLICWLDIRTDSGRVAGTGWNVYMNNRLIMLNDTTADTGWIGQRPFLPKFHTIYDQFRGIVFINTEVPYKLPMNTAKNGFNKETKLYQHLLDLMCHIARPLIDFLSTKYDQPKTRIEDTESEIIKSTKQDGITEKHVRDAENADFTSTFEPPVRQVTPQERETSIQYSKPKRRVDMVRKALNVKTNYQVGDDTFEYFWASEGLDGNK